MVNLSSFQGQILPTAEQLPCSDETPVDNQLQNDIPNLLLSLLASVWAERQDWYFGVDMAIYYSPDEEAIVPDGFLALGVQRHNGTRGRLSYVLWSEQVTPILALEVISERYNSEYEDKLDDYQNLGILYYAVYNPFSGRRGRYKFRQKLEIYKLVQGKYKLISGDGNWTWLPEIGLGLGCEHGEYMGWEREWLYWYDRDGVRYATDAEMAAQERQQKLAERQQRERLESYLRSQGIDPDQI
ncbi:MAG: Uma2 family endonuclease [Pseudanabaenaceae cyanobacterium bins.39]|nr:Uma2 family endonuclease [Pseudanabaenaceae cyanobacterium bins.39]